MEAQLKKRRIELDGIRGFGVLSAVIYHLDDHYAPGAFVAIGMFFVLSGYLISQNINVRYENKSFSILNFYSHRISRLIPTLYFVLLISLVLGCFLMLPQHLYDFADSVRSALTFRINYYLNDAFNYFYKTNRTRPLLHLWSLSLEEQFYFIFPVTFLALSRFLPKKKHVPLVLLFLAVLSFSYGEWVNRETATMTFSYYFFFARAGELLLGCFLGLSEKKLLESSLAKSRYLADAGFVVLFFSFFYLDQNVIFPGFNSLWPALATIALIFGMNHPQSLIKKLLSTRPLVYFGLISYSLYLWHFPLLAYGRYMFMGPRNSSLVDAGYLLVSWMVAHLSWRYIETPLRFQKRTWQQNVFLVWLLPGVILFMTAQVIMNSEGWKSRSAGYPVHDGSNLILCSDNIEGDCLLNNPPSPAKKMILFGDSNAGHYMLFWKEIAEKYNFKILAANAGGCFPSLHEKSDYKIYGQIADIGCKHAHDFIAQRLSEYDTVIMAVAWGDHLTERDINKVTEDFTQTLSSLQHSGKKVLVMQEIPKYINYEIQHYLATRYAIIPLPWDLQYMKDQVDVKKGLEETAFANVWVQKIIRPYPNTTYMNLTELSPLFRALPFYKDRVLYANGTHLSLTGSKLIGQDVLQTSRVKLDQILMP